MQFKSLAFLAFAAGAFADLSQLDPALISSVLAILPAEVRSSALMSPAAIASEFANGATPTWYSQLGPTEQAFLSSHSSEIFGAFASATDTSASSGATDSSTTGSDTTGSTASETSTTTSATTTSGGQTTTGTDTTSGSNGRTSSTTSSSSTDNAATLPTQAIGAAILGVAGFLGVVGL